MVVMPARVFFFKYSLRVFGEAALLRKPRLREEPQRAVYGGKPDAGVGAGYFKVKLFGADMARGVEEHLRHGLTLARDFQAFFGEVSV